MEKKQHENLQVQATKKAVEELGNFSQKSLN